MKKIILAFTLGCLIPALLFSFYACNSKDDPSQQAITSKINDISMTIDMGGELNTIAETVNQLTAYKKRIAETGDDNLEAVTYDKNLIEEILKQPDCQAIKIFLGYDTKAKRKNLIIMGVDSNGNIITKNPFNNDEIVADNGIKCPAPPVCGPQ